MGLPRKRVSREKLGSRKAGAAPKKGGSTASRKSTKHGDALTDEELLELVPGGLAHSFVTARLHDKSLAVAGLSAPADWSGDMPEVPEDIATEDHDSLSNLLAAFVNAYSTAIWHASKAQVEASAYNDIAEYLEDIAILDAEGSNDTQRKASARTDERVLAAKGLYRIAHSDYLRFRDLASTLEKKHRTVSRVGGFVGDEADMGDNASAFKRSARGKAAGKGRGSAKGSGRPRSRR